MWQHHKSGSNTCQVCSTRWGRPYAILADHDFEHELRSSNLLVYNKLENLVRKKFFKYEDLAYEAIEAAGNAAREEEQEEITMEKKLKAKEPIDYDPQTPMGQMQKMFGWDREQQEWALKVIKEKEQ